MVSSTDDFIFLSSCLPAHKNQKLVVEVPSHEWKIWTNVKMVLKKKLLQINRDEKQKNVWNHRSWVNWIRWTSATDESKNDKIKKRQWVKTYQPYHGFPVFFTCFCKNHPPEEIRPGKILAGGAGDQPQELSQNLTDRNVGTQNFNIQKSMDFQKDHLRPKRN